MSSKWNDNLKGFENLDIDPPCCQSKTSLNELEHPSACFGLCAIEIQDAPRQLTRGEFQSLEQQLGWPLVEVRARY